MEIEATSSGTKDGFASGGGGGGSFAFDNTEGVEHRFGGGGGGGGRDHRGGAYLIWEDLTVVLPNFGHGPTKKLLHGVHGYAEPGRIMAIMGPSGSGKSTLLDSLAGRLSTNVVMTGNVLLNGQKRRLDYGVVAYVTQEDTLLGTLTVRETITYSANLRLPTTLSKIDIKGIIDGTIMEMGLQDCADRVIGNWHLRGISGGERKRLSIALEFIIRPRLLFLDEPTSGLDSASAFFVVQALKNIARDGRTVISSIHQPSSEVFALFDDLCLLSGGEVVYFGEAKTAVKFFAEAGFPCPSRRNPSDHFLRCINSDFDVVTATLKGSLKLRTLSFQEAPAAPQPIQQSDPFSNMATADIKALLADRYRSTGYASRTKSRIKEIATAQGLEIEVIKGSQAGWLKQLSTLTRRSFVNMSRDVGYYWSRLVIYIVVAFSVGTLFYDVGTGYTAILARGACAGFVTGFMTFMSIGGFPSFLEEMKVFYKERMNGHYGVAVYILSNFLSSFPYLVAISLTTGTIVFFMVRFRSGFSYYAFFCLNLFGCIAVVESCMMIVASLVPNFLMGLIAGAGVLGIMMMTAGFFRLLPDLPKVFWRYPVSLLGYGSWSLQGGFKNDMLGVVFEPLVPGDPKLKGEDVLKNIFRLNISYSKWWDLLALYALFIAYRILFFFILKLKERATPFFRSLYAKRTAYHLKSRPSFRKRQSLLSRNTHHSLSSQEGLSSPIP